MNKDRPRKPGAPARSGSDSRSKGPGRSSAHDQAPRSTRRTDSAAPKLPSAKGSQTAASASEAPGKAGPRHGAASRHGKPGRPSHSERGPGSQPRRDAPHRPGDRAEHPSRGPEHRRPGAYQGRGNRDAPHRPGDRAERPSRDPEHRGPGTYQGRGDRGDRRPGFHLGLGVILVYEDESIIVIDKPAGLLTVATPKEQDRTVFRVLRDYLSRDADLPMKRHARVDARHEGAYVGVVHRLDRDTSGIMIFVKHDEARQKLTRDWINQVSDRRYLAIVHGCPKPPKGTVHNWLRQNKALRVYAVDKPEPGAEEAITHYELVRQIDNRSLVELKLETGRTNQIRVHLLDLGCPIIGDRKYGLARKIKGGPAAAKEGRLALHARRITFNHPEDGRPMTFESPLPTELKNLLKKYPSPGALADEALYPLPDPAFDDDAEDDLEDDDL